MDYSDGTYHFTAATQTQSPYRPGENHHDLAARLDREAYRQKGIGQDSRLSRIPPVHTKAQQCNNG